MQRVVRTITLAILAVVGPVGSASAHIAPSETENNRYLKITPAGDRIRLAYTVFYGEEPGAGFRQQIDTNHDGQVSDAEAQVFGTARSAEVAAALELTLDGKTLPVTWQTIAVGMGSSQVSAGSFSIDFVTTVCSSGGGQHTLLVRDRFRIPNPGETEAKVEDALGITIDHTHVGVINDLGNDYKFVGPGGPLLDDGIAVAFTVTDKAPMQDASCKAARSGGGGSARGRIVFAAIGGGIGLGIAIVMSRRGRRKTT
ncbi:hypothetical protein BH11MYX2_BH11MYX2_16340 [soil metagenome]